MMNTKFQIKEKLILLSIYGLFTFYSSAQDYQSNVCTPKGNPVVAFITGESSDSARAYYDAYYASTYPNAIQLLTYDGYSSTRKFNCHGFAWHISDGGTDRWIGYGYPYDNEPEYGYWQDESYDETTNAFQRKVNWSSGDHSAITTVHPDTLISKWNEFPFMKHAWDDSPYGTSNLKYYRLNFFVTGPSLICDDPELYSLSNTPGGTITWSQSNNISRYSSQGSNPCYFSPASDGMGWISADFTSGCGTSFTVLSPKDVWVGEPDAPYNILDEICYGYCAGQECIFRAENNNEISTTSYYWSVSNGYVTFGQGDLSASIYFSYPGMAMISVYAYNDCGQSSVTNKYVYVSNCGRGLMVYPNPAKDEITFSIDEELELSKDAVYEITDNFMNKLVAEPLNTKEKTINISGLKKGLYYISVYTSGELITEKFLKD
ncbi:MAG TPA: T9SS type A sorting domain-containing protein [Draconibacterium sp.]|nr:T9SS type A sorting domain-containing protein [Draconibacterium sp.]